MSDAADALRRRDEILQVMYWMQGEGLGAVVAPQDLRRFLDETDEDVLVGDLETLRASGHVERPERGGYRLTPLGREEGGRRFHDEFHDFVRPGHGECNDPLCDCRTEGPDACIAAH